MPFIAATYVYASSQGSARTPLGPIIKFDVLLCNGILTDRNNLGVRFKVYLFIYMYVHIYVVKKSKNKYKEYKYRLSTVSKYLISRSAITIKKQSV
jgi:hypothetical protein